MIHRFVAWLSLAFLSVIPSSIAGASSGSSASISLNEVNPYLGQWVTFSYTLPKQSGGDCTTFGKRPCAAIELHCYQGGELVYGELYPAAHTNFQLGAGLSPWTERGGPADCVATLGDYTNPFPQRGRWQPFAETAFAAGG